MEGREMSTYKLDEWTETDEQEVSQWPRKRTQYDIDGDNPNPPSLLTTIIALAIILAVISMFVGLFISL